MVFLFIFIIFFTFMITILFSNIIIEIYNLKINSKKDKKINSNYNIVIKLKVFNKITILKSVYNEKKINKINRKLRIKSKINNLEIKKVINKINAKNKFNIDVIKIFIRDMFQIIDFDFKVELGTENANITAILVGMISTVISILLRWKIKKIKFQRFKIIPLYTNENIININISGIFSIKVIHIITIINILLKEKGEEKYERTSNRKPYDYSYE